MNYGHYFSVNYEFSSRADEIEVYSYRVLRVWDDKERLSLFPVYVTLSRESINFIVHYFNDKNKKQSPSHLHTAFLSVPLIMHREKIDRVVKTLAEVYESPYPPSSGVVPISGEDEPNSDYLHRLVGQLRKGAESNLHSQEAAAGRAFKTISYSELDEFGVYDAAGKMIVQEKVEVSFIRKIILDFLFDLKHTRVFQTSPYYEYIYSFMHEHYFLGSLLKKADFYYYRELLANRLNRPDARLEAFYGDHLLKAEAEWTEAIRSPVSDEVYSASGGWFDAPEEEMNKIYMVDRRDKESAIYNELLNDSSLLKVSYLLSSKWYMRRYALPNLFRILFPGSSRIAGQLLLLSCFLFYSVRLFSLSYLCHPLSIITGILLVVATLNFINSHAAELKRVSRFWGIHVFIPRLFIAIVAGWVTISLGTDILGFNAGVDKLTPFRSFLENRGNLYMGLVTSLLASMFILVFYQTGKYNPYGQGRTRAGLNKRMRKENYRNYQFSKLKKSLALLLIGWIYSFSIGLFVFSLFILEGGFLDNLFCSPPRREMLLYTIFAQFIGVFIQLTFEEKPMTEEL